MRYDRNSRSSATRSTSVIAPFLILLCSCSTAPVGPQDLPPIPASLMQLCEPLRPLQDGRQGEVVSQMIDDAEQYRLCAMGKASLIEVVKFREKLYEGDRK